MALLRSLATLVVLTTTPSWTAASLFVTDYTMRRMVSFNDVGQCSTQQDRRSIMRAVLTSSSHQVRTTSSKEIEALMEACIQYNSLPSSDTRTGLIYPGTKWCGPGNLASNYDDLGPATGEDRCCRDHDHCPTFLRPGQCIENVCNYTPFTRSECKCDNKFMDCLKGVGSSTSDTIGYIYFNIAKVMCFHDSTRCLVNEVDCKYKYMPYYETANTLAVKQIFSDLFRGVLRLKHHIFGSF